jgi:hypothetical protein
MVRWLPRLRVDAAALFLPPLSGGMTVPPRRERTPVAHPLLGVLHGDGGRRPPAPPLFRQGKIKCEAAAGLTESATSDDILPQVAMPVACDSNAAR